MSGWLSALFDTLDPFCGPAGIFTWLGQGSLIACGDAGWGDEIAFGVKVTITSKGKLPFSTSLPHAAAYRVVGTLDSGKNKVANYFDVIILGKGKAITAITISSFKVAPPASFEKGLATIVASRMSGGPGAA